MNYSELCLKEQKILKHIQKLDYKEQDILNQLHDNLQDMKIVREMLEAVRNEMIILEAFNELEPLPQKNKI